MLTSQSAIASKYHSTKKLAWDTSTGGGLLLFFNGLALAAAAWGEDLLPSVVLTDLTDFAPFSVSVVVRR